MTLKWDEAFNENVKTEIQFLHRGMAFDENGREYGYMIVLRYFMVDCGKITNGSFHYLLYAEKNEGSTCMSYKSIAEMFNQSTTPNGRSYKFKFIDPYGVTMYIE